MTNIEISGKINKYVHIYFKVKKNQILQIFIFN